MKKQRILLIAGFCFVLIGAGIVRAPVMDYLRGKRVAAPLNGSFSSVVSAEAAPAPKPTADQVVSGKPVRLQLPSVGVDLTVAEGKFNVLSKTWTLSNDKAHYAVNTPLANNSEGNTFIYGHNRKGVLKTLSRIKAGDEAVITTDNGYKFIYKFKAAYETDPNDDSLFDYKGAPILTVQTCSGLRFENRQLFTFTLEKVT